MSPSADGGAASPVVLVGVSGGAVSLAVPTLPAVDDMLLVEVYRSSSRR